MDDGSIFMIVALIILIGLSAFFSAAETAYNSLNEIRLRSKAEDGDAKAAHTLALVERYDSLLSTILIGNNIVNIGASSLATVLFTRLVGGVYGPTVSTVVMTLLVLAFGEITPKSMAKEMPETMAMAFAPVLSALVTIFTPLNALFGAWKKFLAKRFDTGEKDTITEGELVTMVSEAEKDGELTNRESELIRSAIEFDDVEAQDVLTPRVDVVAVADDTPMDEVTERFAESGYSRLPVYHDTIDNIIGVVHEKDCFAALQKHDKNVKLEDLIGPTLYTTSVAQTFKPPPSAENTPAANSSESPGKNGKNTSPVSTNTMRNSGEYTHTGPSAIIQPAMAPRGSLSRSTKKLMMSMYALQCHRLPNHQPGHASEKGCGTGIAPSCGRACFGT